MTVRTARAIGLGLLVLGAIVYRLWFGAEIDFPLGNDSAYYRAMGLRGALGPGLWTEDIVWHFLGQPDALTHPSHDYWMPGASLLVAASVALLGPGPGPETLPTVLFAGLFAWLTFLLAERLSGRAWVGFAAGATSVFAEWPTHHAVDPDSTLFYAVFVTGALLAGARFSAARAPTVLAAGLLAGLAHLTRGDGVLTLLVLALWLAHLQRTKALALPARRAWPLLLGGYLVVMGPLMVRNLAAFGTPLPPGSSQAVWITSYDQIYALSAQPTPAEWLARGPAAVLAGFDAGLRAALTLLLERSSLLLAPFAVAGAALAWRRHPSHRVFHLFALALVLFHGTATAIVGGFFKSYMALVPFALACAALGLSAALDAARARLATHRLRPVALLALALAFAATPLAYAFHGAPAQRARLTAEAAHERARYDALTAWVTHEAPQAVTMSTRPWRLWYATGRPALSVPSDGPDAVLAAARRFGATHLVLDGYYLSPRPGYAELHRLFTRRGPYPAVRHEADVAGFQIYAFQP